MSDYTPTTQQVRDGYRYDPEDDYRNPLQAGANAERAGRDFDRWLWQVRAEAWQEGHDAGWEDRHEDALIGWMASGPHESDAHNPYRQETEA